MFNQFRLKKEPDVYIFIIQFLYFSEKSISDKSSSIIFQQPPRQDSAFALWPGADEVFEANCFDGKKCFVLQPNMANITC